MLIVKDGSPFLKTIGLILAQQGLRTCVIVRGHLATIIT